MLPDLTPEQILILDQLDQPRTEEDLAGRCAMSTFEVAELLSCLIDELPLAVDVVLTATGFHMIWGYGDDVEEVFHAAG